jgi:CheY-like chemotaxis protein
MRLLFVDDFENTAEALAELAGLLGHVTAAATTADEALLSAAMSLPDVVFIDIKLGEDDGRDLCRRLRSDLTHRRCKFVAFTGSVVSDGVDGGIFDAVLGKPVGIADLEALLRLWDLGS